jgi:hypothetical protein
MTPRDVHRRLAEYDAELRALCVCVERDAGAGGALCADALARLRTFVERLNADLLQLYERAREPGLTEAEGAVLLPVVEQLRDLLRGIGGLRDSAAAARRLRSAAGMVAPP